MRRLKFRFRVPCQVCAKMLLRPLIHETPNGTQIISCRRKACVEEVEAILKEWGLKP